jgi:hypothetical protein
MPPAPSTNRRPDGPALACAICGRVFVRPALPYDVDLRRKQKKEWEDWVRAHVRYCKGYRGG